MDKLRVDLFVLNYNGETCIRECVHSLMEALKQSVHRCSLFVIDNCSRDQSVTILQREFPQLYIYQMAKNNVLCSFNEPVAKSNADVVFLLNNDLKVDPFFIDPMVSWFEEKKEVFLVAAKSFLPDGSYEAGRAIPFISYGMFGTTCHFRGFEQYIDKPGLTFASGFGAFDRHKFVELGGFDDLYLPGRLEDSDISFRAWKKGWKSYYQPKSTIYHLGAKSFKERFGERGTMELAHRNTFLFMWKNMESNTYWAQHFLFLIPRIFWMLLKGRYEFATGFLKAIWRLSAVLERRKQQKEIRYTYADKEVMSFFKNGN